MSELVLHHYALSPYSEKVRALLGYAGLPWKSVVTREMPPRPMLAALAGGYRRVPVAQAGSDVFCDSRTIASEIAERAGKPELAHESMGDEERRWVANAEGEVFFACILAGGSAALRRKARRTLSLLDGVRFLVDRVGMGRSAAIPMPGFRRSGAILREHLGRVEAALDRDFLFGDAPRIADFATYHSLWFVRDLGEKPIVGLYPRTVAWMDRIAAFGEGRRSEISAEAALAIARDSAPRAIPAEHTKHEAIGSRVEIAPSDYAQQPTSGELVGSTPSRWIVRREDTRAGSVHVHFPKEGYTLTSR